MKQEKAKIPGKYRFKDVLKVLLTSLRQYKNPSILSMVFITLESVCECLIPYFSATLMNIFEAHAADKDYIFKYAFIYGALLLVLATLSFTFGTLSAKLSAKAAAGFARNLREDEFHRIADYSFENIDKFSTSSLVTRQTTDVSYIQLAYMMCIRLALRAPTMLIFSIVMAVLMAPSLSWIYAITIPILAFILIIVIWKVLPIFLGVFKRFDKLNQSVQENIRGIRVVKTYVREEYEKEKFDRSSEDIKKDFVKAERLLSLTTPSMYVTSYISFSLILLIGSYVITMTAGYNGAKIVYGDISFGKLSAMVTYGFSILSSLLMLSIVFVNVSMSYASMRRVYEVLIERPSIVSGEKGIKEVKDGDIRFENVSFKYRPDAEKFALADVNLHIRNGETVGIIGGTGSSKSTLVSLISRFYDVTDGVLSVGGVDVRDYDLEALRENIGMVLQKNVLFYGTIKENLRWGNKNATDKEIEEACHIAQADSFIEVFPEKYDTLIYQGGTNVSGGQKQRLCIARALLKKPKILILDDSTSAVDTKTDAYIRKGLRETLPSTTKIIIAQRISSVKDADYILVMDDGKINGIGTHEELLKTNPIYQEINAIQSEIGGLGE